MQTHIYGKKGLDGGSELWLLHLTWQSASCCSTICCIFGVWVSDPRDTLVLSSHCSSSATCAWHTWRIFSGSGLFLSTTSFESPSVPCKLWAVFVVRGGVSPWSERTFEHRKICQHEMLLTFAFRALNLYCRLIPRLQRKGKKPATEQWGDQVLQVSKQPICICTGITWAFRK